MNKFQTHPWWHRTTEPQAPKEVVTPGVTHARVEWDGRNYLGTLWPDEICPIILGAGRTRGEAHLATIAGLESHGILPEWQKEQPLLLNPFLSGDTKFTIMVEVLACASKVATFDQS